MNIKLTPRTAAAVVSLRRIARARAGTIPQRFPESLSGLPEREFLAKRYAGRFRSPKPLA
jgi:hypothetical protein